MQSAVTSAVTSTFFGHFGLGGSVAGSALTAAQAAQAAQAAPASSACTPRTFVAGEKFWVTGIVAQTDGILIGTFSDPYNDVRYYGEIKFLFPASTAFPPRRRGLFSLPPPVPRIAPEVDDFMKTVAEVITVAPADDQSDQAGQPTPAPAPESSPVLESAPAPAPAPAAISVIPPPPLPVDTPPPTIEPGQTEDQVIATFGQPIKVAKFGVKDIFFYKDMKVTFNNGKVSNVE
jgi:hypothetical protein